MSKQSNQQPGQPLVLSSGTRSVAAGRDIHQVATGDFVTQVQNALVLPLDAIQLAPCDTSIFNVPGRVSYFVGREGVRSRIDEAFGGESEGAVVLVGLGGVGKTALAADWAAGLVGEHNPIWWISAGSTAEINAGLIALGRALRPLLAGVAPDKAIYEYAQSWLSANDGWLLVLDNVDDPENIKHLFARFPNGRFLITSRRAAASWRGVATPIEVGVLTSAEANKLFGYIYGREDQGIANLCEVVGFLPLAIGQVAAYCREAQISPRDFQMLLDRYPEEMLSMQPEGGDPQRTVARTWRTTLDRLANTPEAQGILRAIAWFAPERIPRAYLDGLASPLALAEGLRRLSAYSMIRLGGDLITVHPLVQAVTRVAEPHMTEGIRNFNACRLYELRPNAYFGEAARAWATHVLHFSGYVDGAEDNRYLSILFIEGGLRLARIDPARGIALCERGCSGLKLQPDRDRGDPVSSTMAKFHLLNGNRAAALPFIEKQLSMLSWDKPTDRHNVLSWQHLQILALSEVNRSRAEALAREWSRKADETLGSHDPLTIRFALSLAEFTSPSAGVPELEARLMYALPRLGENDPDVASLERRILGRLVQESGGKDSVKLARRLVNKYWAALGPLDRATIEMRVTHIALLARAGRYKEAHRLASALMNGAAKEGIDLRGATAMMRFLRE